MVILDLVTYLYNLKFKGGGLFLSLDQRVSPILSNHVFDYS